MGNQTGENEQALGRIIDMIRMCSIVILLLHFYYFSYSAFERWGLTGRIGDSLLASISRSGIFSPFHRSKGIALILLGISLLGVRGKKEPRLSPQAVSGR